MKGRYEIKDREDPKSKGSRFTSLDNARREWGWAFPQTRWFIWDRQDKKEVV